LSLEPPGFIVHTWNAAMDVVLRGVPIGD